MNPLNFIELLQTALHHTQQTCDVYQQNQYIKKAGQLTEEEALR